MKKIYLIFIALQILSFSAYAYLDYSPSTLNFQANPGGITTSLTFTATNPSSSTTTWSVYPNVIDGNYAWVQSITPTDADLKPGESQVFTVKVIYPHNAGTYSYTPKFTLEGYWAGIYTTITEAAPSITLVSTGPPAPPTNQTVSCLKTNSAILSWTPSTTVGVTGYKITVQSNSTSTYYTSSNSYTLYDLSSGTKYNFKVDAYVSDDSYISNSSYSTFTTLTGNELGAIQGPNELCLNSQEIPLSLNSHATQLSSNSQATYSCNNIPGATYYWNTPGFSGSSSTNNINLISQAAGLNTISVYYVKGCYTSPTISLTIRVSSSKPYNLSITGISNLTMLDPWDFKILPAGGFYPYEGTLSLIDGAGLATSYTWTESSRSGVCWWWPNGSSVDVAAKNSNSTMSLKLTASNSCGSYSRTYMFTTTDLAPQIVVTPNPASDNVQVTIVKSENIMATSDTISNIPQILKAGSQNVITNYVINIYNSFGTLFYSTKKSGDTFTVPVNNLKDGTYMVEVNDGKQSYRKQLIVKR